MTKDRWTGEKLNSVCVQKPSQKRSGFKEIDLWAYLPFQHLWRSDKPEEEGGGVIGTVNCEKVNVWGKLMGGKCYLLRLVMQTSPGRIFLSLLVQGTEQGRLHKGKFMPAFRQRGGGQRVFLVSAFSQSPLDQNNPYGKADYFREADSDPLPLQQRAALPEEGPHPD